MNAKKSPKNKKSSPKITNVIDDPITVIETIENDVEMGGRRRRKAASAAVAKQREMMSDGADEDVDDGDDEFRAGVYEM